jgi:hypothetical protein
MGTLGKLLAPAPLTILFAISTAGPAQDGSTNVPVARPPLFQAAGYPNRPHGLPVSVGYMIRDDCIPIIRNESERHLRLHITAISHVGPFDAFSIRSNACVLELDSGEQKQVNVLEGWVLTHEDLVSLEISHPEYESLTNQIINIQTPSLHVAARQADIYRAFQRSTSLEESNHNAQILSDLWRADLLADNFKDRLAQDHFHLHLAANTSTNVGAAPWVVHTSASFPFPPFLSTSYTPTLYVNGKIKWEVRGPQTVSSMGATEVHITANTLKVNDGDVLQCTLGLKQVVHGKTWQKTLWSDKLAARK